MAELPEVDQAAQVEQLCKRLDSMLDHLSGNSQSTTVVHRTEGLSPWATAAVVACFCTWFGLILVMFDLHDSRAWVDILRQRVTILEGKGK